MEALDVGVRGDRKEGGLLVGVFAVAEFLVASSSQEKVGEVDLLTVRKVACDQGVVEPRGQEGLQGHLLSEPFRLFLILQAEEARVVGGVGDDGDPAVVLGGGADHGWAPDIDELDHLVRGELPLLPNLLEGVEVDDHQVDGGDFLLLPDRIVCASAVKNAAEDLGVKGLHATVKDLWKPGDLFDRCHCEASLLKELGGAARGEKPVAFGGQLLGELFETCLIVNRE
ncbi:MAG: hypothetical protein BWY86_00628 [Candidatus Aminicenantes bacterium ADurb.Bin508]|nr:MAG: hypothetical protein BWY86_00628 [Candidatus Aminicenantes bacterium ADurb.Bin508]